MPASLRQVALRIFWAVLRELAHKYHVSLPQGVLHSAQAVVEAEALKAYKLLLKSVHPDKGGSLEDCRSLLEAKAAWDDALSVNTPSAPSCPQPKPPPVYKRPAACKAEAPRKAPRGEAATPPVCSLLEGPSPQEASLCMFCGESASTPESGYRIQSNGVLLTYNGVSLQSEDIWEQFTQWILDHFRLWGVLYYCGTYERCRNNRGHLHLMLQFRSVVDKFSSVFTFQRIPPNARPAWKDYCGGGRHKKNPQQGMDRGFFYVWANKIGTCLDKDGEPCVFGNYMPVWSDARFRYEVKAEWGETLWKKRYLTHATWGDYLLLCRDRVPARQQNLAAVLEGEQEAADKIEVVVNRKRIRSNPKLYRPFKKFALIELWKAILKEDRLRYPMLLIHAESGKGKTELGKSCFDNPLSLKVGDLTSVFPARMRLYDRRMHDGIVMDDLRDLLFLSNFQHVFQGKPDEMVTFAETQGGTRAYSKLLFRTPFVGTINDSTTNLQFLESHDFLSKPGNVMLLKLTESPFEDVAAATASHSSPAPPPLPLRSAEDAAGTVPLPHWHKWTVAAVAGFLKKMDMLSAARLFTANDVSGKDFASLTQQALVSELGMSVFAAKKVLEARATLTS